MSALLCERHNAWRETLQGRHALQRCSGNSLKYVLGRCAEMEIWHSGVHKLPNGSKKGQIG